MTSCMDTQNKREVVSRYYYFIIILFETTIQIIQHT